MDNDDFETSEEFDDADVERILNQANNTYFIFVNGKIKSVGYLEWARWFHNIDNRRIDYTDISNEPNYPGGDFISTVFIGLDFIGRFDPDHLPMIFETMVFGGKYHNCGWKFSSYGEAKRGHWQIVDCIRAGEKPFVEFGERPAFELFMEMFAPDPDEEEVDDDSRENS